VTGEETGEVGTIFFFLEGLDFFDVDVACCGFFVEDEVEVGVCLLEDFFVLPLLPVLLVDFLSLFVGEGAMLAFDALALSFFSLCMHSRPIRTHRLHGRSSSH